MEAVAMVQLSVSERTNLQRLEGIIERGLGTFNDVGAALSIIRDSRLYRETHGTFEDYCHDRWGMSKPYATQIIQAAKVRENLVAIATVLPITESQARPLTKLEPEAQREVWSKAVETAPEGKVTAKHVERTVTEWTYNQGVQYGAAASTYAPPAPEPELKEDEETITIRAFELGYFMALGKRYTAAQVAAEFKLSPSGAYRLLTRASGSKRVPLYPEDDGVWCVDGIEAKHWPY